TTRAWIAYSRAKNEKPKLTAAPQNIQPIGCVRWVLTMSAPITPQANNAAMLQISSGLSRPTNLSSRARLTPARATQSATLDHATQRARAPGGNADQTGRGRRARLARLYARCHRAALR